MEKGPPPGGYGLHSPEATSEEPIDDVPPASPFRTAQRRVRARSKRWIGLPILGLVLLVVRMAFFWSQPTHELDPGTFPTMLPTVMAPIVAPVELGSMAVDDRGHAYFVKNGHLWTQQGDGTPQRHFVGQGAIRDVAVGFRNVFVIDDLGIRRVSEFGEAETVVTGNFFAMELDGRDAIALGPTSIHRVNLAKGTVTTIASTDPRNEELTLAPPLAVSKGFVWFGMTGGVGRVASGTDHTIVAAAFAEVTPFGFAPSANGVLVASEHGVVELGGKTPQPITPVDWHSACHEVLFAGSHVFVTFFDEAGWTVARVGEGRVEPIVHTAVQPRLTGRSGTVLWSTPEGVRSAPD